jgi:hypothetical protein
MTEPMTDLEQYAVWDWLTWGLGTTLHAARTATWDDDADLAHDVTTLCGQTTPEAYLPGVASRLAAHRCDQCCHQAGLPEGDGSPKNDPSCRLILGLE